MTTDFLEGVKMAEQHAKTFRLTNKNDEELYGYLAQVGGTLLKQARDVKDMGLIAKSIGFINYKDRLGNYIFNRDASAIDIILTDQELKAD